LAWETNKVIRDLESEGYFPGTGAIFPPLESTLLKYFKQVIVNGYDAATGGD
jgi:hypothetical protein